MIITLVILVVISAIALIATVLLQSGRSAGLGAISGAGEAVFGKKKGMDELFGTLTAILAAVFLLSCLGLAILAK